MKKMQYSDEQIVRPAETDKDTVAEIVRRYTPGARNTVAW